MPARRSAAPTYAVRLAVALVCAALAGYLALSARDERTLRTANEQGRAGQAAAALREARGLTRAPVAARAHLTAAYAALELGRTGLAVDEFEAALERDRDNWVVHRDLAIALLRAGRRRAAERRMVEAVRRNPRMRVPLGFPR